LDRFDEPNGAIQLIKKSFSKALCLLLVPVNSIVNFALR